MILRQVISALGGDNLLRLKIVVLLILLEFSRQKNKNCRSFTLVLESINPTIGAGVLRDDESNGEGLMPEFQGRNSKFSDGDTLNMIVRV